MKGRSASWETLSKYLARPVFLLSTVDCYAFCQEERRCRQLELEVGGLSAEVAAAEANSKRLEETLNEARAERDLLKVGTRLVFCCDGGSQEADRQLKGCCYCCCY